MTAFRTRAFVSCLFALLIAMLIAFAKGGAIARADTPAAHPGHASGAASAGQADWAEDAQSRDRSDASDRSDVSDRSDARDRADDRDREDDEDTREEARDRRNIEEYFDWNGGWQRHFKRQRSHGDEIVNFGRDSDLPAGAHADTVVSIFGSASSEGDTGDVVAILGDTKTSGYVKDSAVAVLGNVHIDGPVGGDVVAVLGNVDLGPHAEVGGDVAAVGGAVTRDPAAVVRGDVQSVGGFTAGFGRFRPWIDHCLFYGRPLALVPGIGWAWSLALIFLALYVFLALLFRDAVTRCASTVETQPGMTLVAALLSILLVPIAIVLLCITVIGIAAIPFVVFGLFCMALFGKAVMLAWLGRRVIGRGERLQHPAVAVLVGGLIALVLYLVPVLGFLVYKILGLFGFGAVVYTLILAGRARRHAQPAGAAYAGASAAAGAVPPGGAPLGPTPTSAAAGGGGGTGAAAAPGAGVGAGAGAGPGAGAGAGAGATAAGRAAPPPHFMDPAVVATLPRAGFWIRMGALLLDVLLVGILMSMLHHSSDLELIVLAVYGALMWKLRGSTVGGIVFHLQVVRVDGRPVDWETAIVRALGCFLSLVVAGLGFFWIAFDSGKQAWHDKIAGTAVVRVPRAVPLV
jgi:uncharacterized RDD family membrane protein YckC